MAPYKVPKKALKSPEPAGGLSPKKKKNSKKTPRKKYNNFKIYIFQVLKKCTDIYVGISRKIMNDLVNDMLEQIACEAGRLISTLKEDYFDPERNKNCHKTTHSW
ncbi:histone H2B type 2-K1-like [Cydia strobilella]|uniref:histone H2B type 2-K1-like n=1 Tax=Cydia strobilella TaxID=1100964 RepID=UPI0030057235